MKRLVTLFSMLLLFVFLLSGCTSKSYNSKSYQSSQLNDKQEVKITPQNDVTEYKNYIGKNISQLISQYGEPDLKDDLYGGKIYYYKDMYTGFGIDGDVITSVLMYKGEINSHIKIGLELSEVLENLKLTDDAIQMSDEFSQYILTIDNGYESYLIFYDEILQEILIK